MPSRYTLNVSLAADLLDFATHQVASERFGTAREIVRDALRRQEADVRASTAPAPAGARDEASPPRRGIA